MFVFQTANHREQKISSRGEGKGTGGLDIISSLAKSKAIGPEPRVFTIHFLRGYPVLTGKEGWGKNRRAGDKLMRMKQN